MPGRLLHPFPTDSWAFFLDVDGTLLDYTERPDAVRAEPAIVQLLAGLHAAAGGALALISGRPIGDIDALFAPLRFPAAGLYGIERRDTLVRLHTHAMPEKPLYRAGKCPYRY